MPDPQDAAFERHRTDVDERLEQAPPTHDEMQQPIVAPIIPTVEEVLGAEVVGEDYGAAFASIEGGDGESTSAHVASTAAKLLGCPNILMRASPYHAEVLQAIKDSGLKADGKTLDLIEALAKVIEPFMRDVRTVAGSALTQFQPQLWEPEPDA